MIVENTVSNNPEQAPDYIRPQGADFAQGFVLSAPVAVGFTPDCSVGSDELCARIGTAKTCNSPCFYGE